MNTSRVRKVVLCGLLVALILAPARRASAAGTPPDPLQVIPEDCLACIRIKNFDFTMSQVDQFLTGLSPIPMGLSMIVRMQLGGILGDPQLAAVNMNGTFGAFVLAIPDATDPNESTFTAILLPVQDYDGFLAAANVAAPDARGVSQIVAQAQMLPIPPMAVKKVGGFAVLTGAQYADMLATVADSMVSSNASAVASQNEVAASDIADASVWIYVNVEKAAELAADLAPEMPSGISMPADPMLSSSGAGATPADFGAMPMAPGMMNFDMAALAEQLPAKSLILGIEPKPNAITMMVRLAAIPGGELEPVFTRGSAPMQDFYAFFGAKPPAESGAEMAGVSALLPNADSAEVAGTYDLMQLLDLADDMPIPMPVELPAPTAPSKSAVAYAVTADKGQFAADIAIPKEHVVEIVDYFKNVDLGSVLTVETPTDTGFTFSQDTQETGMDGFPGLTGFEDTTETGQDEPEDEISKITASPFGNVPTDTGTTTTTVAPSDTIFPTSTTQGSVDTNVTISFEGDNTGIFANPDTGFGGTATASAANTSAGQKVRVAGVRLVRYSDLELGVLPLGRGDGYTLSLIAQLPEPAVKVTGGKVDRATTNNGKDLAPSKPWDRHIRFARLSKDHKTAIFDIELLLPDPGTLGIQDLAGSLDYLTAGGTKDIDLGMLEIKAGTRVSQLGAEISSIDLDPYNNSAPLVGLTLNVPAEEVESIELYDEQDKRIEIIRYGSTSFGKKSIHKFFVEKDLPQKARIVIHTFEGLQKHNIAFNIKGISIAGLPMR